MSERAYHLWSFAVFLVGLGAFLAASAYLNASLACIAGMAIGGTSSTLGRFLYDKTWPNGRYNTR